MINIRQQTRWNIGQSEELRWVYHRNCTIGDLLKNDSEFMSRYGWTCCPLIMGVSGFLFSPKSVGGDSFRKKKWRASASILCGIHKQRKTWCYNIWRHKYKIIQDSIDTIDIYRCIYLIIWDVTCQLSLSKLFVNAATAERNSGLHRAVVMATIHKNNILYIEKHPFIQLEYYHLFQAFVIICRFSSNHHSNPFMYFSLE